MYILIDIPDEDYKAICGHIKKIEAKNGEGIKSWYNLPMRFESAIYHGTPLPKGHKRLMILSEDKLKENQVNLDFSSQKWISEVDLSNAVVTIIEVDTESEE